MHLWALIQQSPVDFQKLPWVLGGEDAKDRLVGPFFAWVGRQGMCDQIPLLAQVPCLIPPRLGGVLLERLEPNVIPPAMTTMTKLSVGQIAQQIADDVPNSVVVEPPFCRALAIM